MVSKNEEPVKKRAKTNTKSDAKTSTSKTSGKAKKVPVQRSRVAGRLAVLMNMPVDVFAEICSHLFPIDLLHLSWASKRLRSILMSKSAKHIWRSARENQLPTLPPCPDDLSEPQYIALLFTNICQVCGANRAQRFHFTMRTRHCASCYKNHTVTLKSLVCGTTLDDFDAREAQQFLWAVPGEGGSQGYEYNTLQVEACVKEYRALKSAKLREEYIVTLEQKTTKIRDHAQKVFSWLDEQDRLKIQQEDEISEARWNSIQEKLLELGWEQDDFPSYYNMEWAKLTQKPQALTDKVWKNLYPKLQPMLQTHRIERLEDERIERRSQRRMNIMEFYQDYQEDKNPNAIFYPTSLWEIPCIKTLVDDDNTGEVTEARWQACIPEVEVTLRQQTEKILEEVMSWYKTCTNTAIEHGTSERKSKKSAKRTAKETSSKQEEAPDMSLVTAAFKCRECGVSLWLSTFLGHLHFKAQYERDHRWTQKDTATTQSELSGPGALVYDNGLREMVPKVLVAMNCDPLTATVQDLVIAPGDRYACSRCEDKHQKPGGFGYLLCHYQAELEWYRTKGDPKKPNTHSPEPQAKGRKRTLQPVARILNQVDAQAMASNYWTSMRLFRGKEGRPGYFDNEYWSDEYHAQGGARRCNDCGYITYGMCSIGKMVYHLEAKHEIVPDFDELDSISWDEDELPSFVAEMWDLMDEEDEYFSSDDESLHDYFDW